MDATEQMLEQLERCAKQFRYYEEQHWAKGTKESDAKAIVNREIAVECEALIARVRAESLK